MRDGVIQRFEYCIDSFWKFLKMYLEEGLKVDVGAWVSHKTFTKALSSQVITSHEFDVLFKSISDRNLTSHTYSEDIAESIQEHIPVYHATMQTIVDRIGMEMQNLK